MKSLDIDGSGEAVAAPSSYDCCPRIYLSRAQCKALGFDMGNLPKPGTEVMATIKCVIASVSASVDMDEKDKTKPSVSVDLSVREMELADSGKSAASVLYGA